MHSLIEQWTRACIVEVSDANFFKIAQLLKTFDRKVIGAENQLLQAWRKER